MSRYMTREERRRASDRKWGAGALRKIQRPACESSNADECALIRERAAAGITNEIAACPVHPEEG